MHDVRFSVARRITSHDRSLLTGAGDWLRRAVKPLLAVLAVASVAPPALAQPALWAIKDADTTIYALGTVHLLRPETQWETPKIEDAIAKSSELWLELPTTDETALAGEMMQLVAKYGVAHGASLGSDLSSDELSRLDAALRGVGLTAAQLDKARPWFVALTLSTSAISAAGFDPASGVDRKIEAIFRKRTILPKGLETAEQQIRIFADMERPQELAYLRQALADYERATPVMNAIVDNWSAGDLASLEKILVDDMRQSSEDIYQALIVRRNEDWTGRIKTLLEQPGVLFVAVGAAHLTGEDSVLAMLSAQGITVERVQ